MDSASLLQPVAKSCPELVGEPIIFLGCWLVLCSTPQSVYQQSGILQFRLSAFSQAAVPADSVESSRKEWPQRVSQ